MTRRVTGRTDHVVVIGAGLGGLATALRLRGAGHEVTVLEAADHVGGRVATETIDGLRFDTGATILTMPELVVDALAAAGADRDEARAELGLLDVDPSYLVRYPDGRELPLWRDGDKLTRAIGDVFGPDAAVGYRGLRRWLAELYDAEYDLFIDRNTDALTDFARDPALRRGLLRLTRLGALRGLDSAVARHLTDPLLRRAFTFQALFAGVTPSRAAAVYAVIAHMDTTLGVTYPAGGMGRIAATMAARLRLAGGRVALGTAAERVRFSGARAVAVVTAGGDEIACDALVITTDEPVTEWLLRDCPAIRRRRRRYSPSAVVVHGGVPADVAAGWPGGHHTVDFGTAWTQTFRDITGRGGPGRLPDDPSLLVTRPAVTDPSAAVGAVEPVSVLAPCPNLDVAPLPWERLRPAYVAEVLAGLERRGYTGIADLAIARVDTPETWAARGHAAGTPFAAAHTVAQTGPLRTPNLRAENIVLAGSSTVPGVGIPPVLVSGRLAAERITG